MRAGDLLQHISIRSVHAPLGGAWQTLIVRGLCIDSRHVQPGDVFVAVVGEQIDGHTFLRAAQQRGVALAVVEHLDLSVPQLVQIEVASTRRAAASLAAAWYGQPATAMTLCAVTGTNGKTTTTHLLEALLTHAGRRTGLLGTIAYRYPGHSTEAALTTPDALSFQRLLADMRAQQVDTVVMEASSHALALDRLWGVQVDVTGFTNLTQDHLDFHGTLEHYFQAKALLFAQHLKPIAQGGRAVVCVDDAYGLRLANQLPAEQVIRVSTQHPLGDKDVWVRQQQLSRQGIVATLQTPVGEVTLHSPLCGAFNLANLAVALGMGVALGLDRHTLGAGLSLPLQVPGRMERIEAAANAPTVFVDYAHTPDALERVLQTLRTTLATPTARLFVVFGCGGDRDPGKRPVMGHIASQYADIIVLTSDNPRSESPAHIADMIRQGIARTETPLDLLASVPQGLVTVLDRRTAIETALHAANAEDVVLLAGKGHENYQLIGNEKRAFDDRVEAQRALHHRAHTVEAHP